MIQLMDAKWMQARFVSSPVDRSELLSWNARKPCARNIIGYRARPSIRRYIPAATVQLFSTATCQFGRARLQVLREHSPWRASEKRQGDEGREGDDVHVSNIFSPRLPIVADNRRYRADANFSRPGTYDVYLYISISMVKLSFSRCEIRASDNPLSMQRFFLLFFERENRASNISRYGQTRRSWTMKLSLSHFSRETDPRHGYVKLQESQSCNFVVFNAIFPFVWKP